MICVLPCGCDFKKRGTWSVPRLLRWHGVKGHWWFWAFSSSLLWMNYFIRHSKNELLKEQAFSWLCDIRSLQHPPWLLLSFSPPASTHPGPTLVVLVKCMSIPQTHPGCLSISVGECHPHGQPNGARQPHSCPATVRPPRAPLLHWPLGSQPGQPPPVCR